MPARIGIKGISAAPYGIGIYGEAIQDGGPSRGVYGKVASTLGAGVFGKGASNTALIMKRSSPGCAG